MSPKIRSLDELLCDFIHAWPTQRWSAGNVVVAVSGGADSVAMLRLLHETQPAAAFGRLIVAHVNHQLRGTESDGDQQFVERLAAGLGLDCHATRVETARHAAALGDGIESAARQLRYQFFEQTAAETGARHIVTAHTADDQAETILHRIVRGTGLNGLAGIERVRGLSPIVSLCRPLLDFHREELRAYLQLRGQPWREDSSNADPRFTRNRLRHELLPRLGDEYNPNVVGALVRLGRAAAEAQAIVDERVAHWLAVAVQQESPGSVVFHRARLVEMSDYLRRELLLAVWTARGWPRQAMTSDHWEQLAALVMSEAEAESRDFPDGVRVELTRDRLRMSRREVP